MAATRPIVRAPETTAEVEASRLKAVRERNAIAVPPAPRRAIPVSPAVSGVKVKSGAISGGTFRPRQSAEEGNFRE